MMETRCRLLSARAPSQPRAATLPPPVCGIGSAVDPDQAGAMAPAEAAAAHRTAQHVLEVVSHPPRGLWVFGLLHSAVVSSPYPD